MWTAWWCQGYFSSWTLVKVHEERQANNSVHLATVCEKKNPKHPRIIKEKTGNKLKNKKSTPTSFEVVFFLVAAKGLNNDRYNGKNVGWLVKRRAEIKRPPYSLHGEIKVVHDIRNRALIQDAAWLASLSLGGSGNGRGLHSSRGGLMMTVGSDLQPPRTGRHQADGVAGEQRQVLGVQEERRGHQVGRVASRGVGEQQVTAIQRSDGDCAARCQSCEGDKKLGDQFPCMEDQTCLMS